MSALLAARCWRNTVLLPAVNWFGNGLRLIGLLTKGGPTGSLFHYLIMQVRPTRLQAVLVHMSISALVVLTAAIAVRSFWYPYPFWKISGGIPLLLLTSCVGIVAGPLLTAIIFNSRKSKRELAIDVTVVATLQIFALVYALYAVASARPVALVFEVDRFVAVSASQVDRGQLSAAPHSLRQPSWLGPKLIATRLPRDSEEMLKSLEHSLQGLEPSVMPGWWETYEEARPRVTQRMKSVSKLIDRLKAEDKAIVQAALKQIGQSEDQLFFLPMTSRFVSDGWIVLLSEHGIPLGYAAVSGFDEE